VQYAKEYNNNNSKLDIEFNITQKLVHDWWKYAHIHLGYCIVGLKNCRKKTSTKKINLKEKLEVSKNSGSNG